MFKRKYVIDGGNYNTSANKDAAPKPKKKIPLFLFFIAYLITFILIFCGYSVFGPQPESENNIAQPYDLSFQYNKQDKTGTITSYVKPKYMINGAIAQLNVYDADNKCIYTDEQFLGLLHGGVEKELVFQINIDKIEGTPQNFNIQVSYQKP